MNQVEVQMVGLKLGEGVIKNGFNVLRCMKRIPEL